jgi:hypothetical protein
VVCTAAVLAKARLVKNGGNAGANPASSVPDSVEDFGLVTSCAHSLQRSGGPLRSDFGCDASWAGLQQGFCPPPQQQHGAASFSEEMHSFDGMGAENDATMQHHPWGNARMVQHSQQPSWPRKLSIRQSSLRSAFYPRVLGSTRLHETSLLSVSFCQILLDHAS